MNNTVDSFLRILFIRHIIWKNLLHKLKLHQVSQINTDFGARKTRMKVDII